MKIVYLRFFSSVNKSESPEGRGEYSPGFEPGEKYINEHSSPVRGAGKILLPFTDQARSFFTAANSLLAS